MGGLARFPHSAATLEASRGRVKPSGFPLRRKAAHSISRPPTRSHRSRSWRQPRHRRGQRRRLGARGPHLERASVPPRHSSLRRLSPPPPSASRPDDRRAPAATPARGPSSHDRGRFRRRPTCRKMRRGWSSLGPRAWRRDGQRRLRLFRARRRNSTPHQAPRSGDLLPGPRHARFWC